jgi:hypothetical protein
MTEINKYGLKYELTELLKADKKITFEFDCGNDEAYIIPSIDGIIMDYGALYFNLEELIYIDLNLPSVGEYMVKGKGYLTIENDSIYLFYDLEGFTYLYDDEASVNIDYEPQKEIREILKNKHLLLSSEYDNPEKWKEYLEHKDTISSKRPVQNNFSTSVKLIWNYLIGHSPENIRKPWWKFW